MKIDHKTQTYLRLDGAELAAALLLNALKEQGGVMARGKALARIERARKILTEIQYLRLEIA